MIIDELRLVTIFKKSEQEIIFKKQYGNKDLMDLNDNHGH